MPAIKSVQSINSFLPDNQDEKLALIDDLALILGPDLELESHEAANDGATLMSIENLLARIDALSQSGGEDRLSSAAQSLADALKTYQSSIQNSDPTGRHQALRRLDEKLLRSFAGRLALLRDSLTAQSVEVNSLPENIRERWLSKSGQYRIEAYPTADITRAGETKRFVHAARTVLGDRATGTPVINISGSDAVKSAFVQAFSYAFVFITALLWIILRSLKEVGIVLSPLILAGLLTSAASVVFSLPFNFANIIALPLLLGIGVDSALHILHRYKTALPANGNLLQTSTARGVFFSALTTIVSFGNLASSTHAGTASMGVMLTIGVVCTLTCTLVVLPALLKQFLPLKPQ